MLPMAEEKGPTAPPGLKIVVVGPTRGGKTTVANYVSADETEAVEFKAAETYNATVGVRILECERNLGGPATPVEVWDVGGSTDYEGCWPAIMQDSHGVIIVYDPGQEGQVSESGAWYEYFVQNNELPDDAALVFAFAPNSQRGTRQRVSPKIEHLNVVNVSLDDGQLVKTQFERFLKAAKARKESGSSEAKGAEAK